MAALFYTTCSETALDDAPTFVDMATTSQTCQDKYNSKCMGTVDDDACTWERKLCVTCYKDYDTGYTKIRVQTNTLPDHCFYSSKFTIVENEIDIEVNFNF